MVSGYHSMHHLTRLHNRLYAINEVRQSQVSSSTLALSLPIARPQLSTGIMVGFIVLEGPVPTAFPKALLCNPFA